MRTFLRQAKSGVELDATLKLGEGAGLPVRLTSYGKSRMRECRLPPLKLSLDPAAARDTPLQGLPTLRLVTHCRDPVAYRRSMLMEYLVYRAYALVAEPALRVRLARVHYADSEGRRRTETHRGFFVEDINHAAARHGLEWSDLERQRSEDLDPEQAALYYLFQYMVGNTDWSALTGPEGETCCHNTAVLEDPDSGRRLLLPYDFDQSGVVDAPYSTPSEMLHIESVRERVYRGFCIHNHELAGAIDRLNQRRSDLENLFLDETLPDDKDRREAWNYLAGFFDLINDPKRLEAKIVKRCRGPSGG